jgi:hypothetical protein
MLMEVQEDYLIHYLKIQNGFSITVTGTDNYTFNLGSTPTVSGRFGGMTVTAGPVTLTP